MKMGGSGDVPRVAGHGACQEGRGVVNEVGNDRFREFLWQPSDCRWTWGRYLRRASREVPVDFELASVPEYVDE